MTDSKNKEEWYAKKLEKQLKGRAPDFCKDLANLLDKYDVILWTIDQGKGYRSNIIATMDGGPHLVTEDISGLHPEELRRLATRLE